MGEGFNSAGGTTLRLRNIVTAVSSAMATRQIIAYSDAWGRAQNQLRQVTTSTAELRDINQQLMDISNRSAVALGTLRVFILGSLRPNTQPEYRASAAH